MRERVTRNSSFFPKLVLDRLDPLLMVYVQRTFVTSEGESGNDQFGGNSGSWSSSLTRFERGSGRTDRLGEVVRFSNDGTDRVRVVREEGTSLD